MASRARHTKLPAAPPDTREYLIAIGLLLLVALVVYWPALTGGFLFDDDTLLTKNDMVRGAHGLYRIWFTTEPLDYWPLTNSSFWFEWRLWGLSTTGYHVTNVLLHVGSAVLIGAILRRLAIPGAWLAALLFVVHPVNVESVAWIAQRKNTLSMFFFLLSILFYVRHDFGPTPAAPARDPAGRGAAKRVSAPALAYEPPAGLDRWYWLSIGAFVLAMLSKGSVATLPAVLLLIVWWKRDAISLRDLLKTAPIFAIAFALTLVNIWFQAHYLTGVIRQVTLMQRLLGAGGVVWFYCYKALLPVRLIFMYPQWDVRVADPRWWVPSLAGLAFTGVLVWQRRQPVVRAVLFAWIFFCIGLIPVMGFTDVYFMKYSLVADHYQYVAMIGIVALEAAAIWHLRALATTRVLWGAVLAVVLGAATWLQTNLYTRVEMLYRMTLAANPSAWMIHNNLGVLLADRDVSEAVWHFEESLRLNPSNIEIHNNLCHSLGHLSRFEEAVKECRETLQYDSNLAPAHNDLGAALIALRQRAPALQEFETAVKLDAGYEDAHNNLANMLATSGHLDEAIAEYQIALRLNPDLGVAHLNLGFALDHRGRIPEAIKEYHEALRLRPDLVQAQWRLDALAAQAAAQPPGTRGQ